MSLLRKRFSQRVVAQEAICAIQFIRNTGLHLWKDGQLLLNPGHLSAKPLDMLGIVPLESLTSAGMGWGGMPGFLHAIDQLENAALVSFKLRFDLTNWL